MKVYLAAPYSQRSDMYALMRQLITRGHVVTSRWVHDDAFGSEDHVNATADLADVDEADVLLFVGPREWKLLGGGGRHVEFGYAVAKGKRIILVGPRLNVFHYLNSVTVVATVDDAFAELQRMAV